MATPLARLEGKYEILDKIREGGMGAVYKVRHRLLEEVRVVKVMRPHLAGDEILRARFLREAKVAIKLRHPNLAQIYDFTMDDSGYAYLVMEFIDGLNLQDVIKVFERPGLDLVLEISRQSLEALGYLHRKRIIHRDVSPDNLLVTRDDEGALQVKLIDLGIAKVRGGDENLTSAGTFVGKVRYSSPEHFQTKGGSEVSAASDLYSFGVVLYEMLTGAYPIKGESVASLISGHLVHPPLDFETSDPDGRVPGALRAVVLKALAKAPENRHSSAAAFSKALQPWLEKHPLDEAALQTIFDLPTITTHKIRTVKPGSTQSRMDRTFGLSMTPPPGEISDSEDELETPGTMETETPAEARPKGAEASYQAQVKALLVGAAKLAEADHFEEARLQLASVLEIDPENVEAREILQAIDAADVDLQNRRQEAAEGVRILVRAESFEQASAQLGKALKEMGRCQLFDQLSAEIDDARAAYEQRQKEVREVLKKAGKLMAKESYEEAVPLLRQSLDLEPGNREMIAALEEAEKGLEKLLDARRREKETSDAVATITDHIEQRDIDEAEHALKLARKLYGPEDIFSDLAERVDELRTALRLEEVKGRCDQARREIAKNAFSTAIEILENALHLMPEEKEPTALMEEAREGLRREEEARKRRHAIEARISAIERLISAERLQSALRLVDTTIEELGDFDASEELRGKIEDSIASNDADFERAAELIETALDQAGGAAFAEAGDTLDEVRKIRPDHPQIELLVEEAEAEMHRRIEARRRQMTIDKVVDSVQHQLDEGNADEAKRELAVAKRLYGDADTLDELGATIEAHEREAKRKEIGKLLKSARRKKRAFEDVLADLEALLTIDPHCEEAHRLLARARTGAARAEDERLEKECEDTLTTIDQLIADGEPEQALEKLDAVVRKVGGFRAARVLREKLRTTIQRRGAAHPRGLP